MAEDAASTDEGRERTKALTRAIDAETIEFAEVVRLKHYQTIANGDEQYLRPIGEQLYDRALAAFKRGHGGAHADVAVFAHAGCGVYALPDGNFKWTVVGRAIEFDWSAAHLLANRVSAVIEQAEEWWGRPRSEEPQDTADDPSDLGADGRGDADKGVDAHDPPTASARSPGRAAHDEHRWPWTRKRRQRRRDRARMALVGPHVDRAYSQATAIFSAVNLESERRRRSRTDRDDPPSDRFTANLSVIEPEVVRMETLLARAGQRTAKQRYGLGMLAGLVLLSVLCGALAWTFAAADLPAWYAVAFPAGGIGAIFSVLERMTSGRLRLDANAGRGMLAVYGAVRPFVGAISGMVVFVLIVGGLLPAIRAPGAPLPFYAGIGFFAGFSERFAQDMLTTASRQVGAGAEPADAKDPGPDEAEPAPQPAA